MDQRQAQADGDGSKSARRALVSGPMDDEKKHESEHNFGNQSRNQAEFARAMIAISVAGEVANAGEAFLARSNKVKYASPDNRSHHLRDNVGTRFRGLEASSGNQPGSDCWIQVATRDMANGVSHGQNGQAESKRYANKADSKIDSGCGITQLARKSGCQNCTATPAKHQPKGANCFCDTSFGQAHIKSLQSLMVKWQPGQLSFVNYANLQWKEKEAKRIGQ